MILRPAAKAIIVNGDRFLKAHETGFKPVELNGPGDFKILVFRQM